MQIKSEMPRIISLVHSFYYACHHLMHFICWSIRNFTTSNFPRVFCLFFFHSCSGVLYSQKVWSFTLHNILFLAFTEKFAFFFLQELALSIHSHGGCINHFINLIWPFTLLTLKESKSDASLWCRFSTFPNNTVSTPKYVINVNVGILRGEQMLM